MREVIFNGQSQEEVVNLYNEWRSRNLDKLIESFEEGTAYCADEHLHYLMRLGFSNPTNKRS